MRDFDQKTPTLPPLDGRITAVLRYWDELRGDRVAPGRIEVRPAAITRHLSRITILERPRAGTVRMRLAGATLSGRMGMELRGMPFRALFELDDRMAAMAAAETAIATPNVALLSLARTERDGLRDEATMAILPLTDTRGALTRAMCIYSERPSVTPFGAEQRGRFVITGCHSLDIPENGAIIGATGHRTGPAPRAQHVLRTRPAAPSAAPALPRLEAQVSPHHARPVFQVIDGGLA